MFLCDKCHDPNCTFHFTGSHGACEGCGQVADCVDCRNMRPAPKRKKRAQKPWEKQKWVQNEVYTVRDGLGRVAIVALSYSDSALWSGTVQGPGGTATFESKKTLDSAKKHARSVLKQQFRPLTDLEQARLPCTDPGDGGCIGGLCAPCAARKRLAKEKRAS